MATPSNGADGDLFEDLITAEERYVPSIESWSSLFYSPSPLYRHLRIPHVLDSVPLFHSPAHHTLHAIWNSTMLTADSTKKGISRDTTMAASTGFLRDEN